MAAQNPLFTAGIQAVEGSADARSIAPARAGAGSGFRTTATWRTCWRSSTGRPGDTTRPPRSTASCCAPSRPTPSRSTTSRTSRSRRGSSRRRSRATSRASRARRTPAIGATLYYNMSLAYLQKFDPQPANEARSQAIRLDPALIAEYDASWKYEIKNENAVVDLGLTADELWAKFGRLRDGRRRGRTSMGKGGGAAVGVGRRHQPLPRASWRCSSAVVVGMWRWRGPRMFTMRCVKCGTPFCRRCHLGAAWEGLCTQCHHLFVVRDGVSGPARNQKLLEVQREDEKRERIFRALSLVFPGRGPRLRPSHPQRARLHPGVVARAVAGPAGRARAALHRGVVARDDALGPGPGRRWCCSPSTSRPTARGPTSRS